MSLPWIRLYVGLVHSPKWLSLPLYARSVWSSLLMLAGEEDRNGDVSEMALATRMGTPGRVLSESLRLLEERGWITRESLASGERVVRVSGWSARQYPSDLAKLRQAKYRESRKTGAKSDATPPSLSRPRDGTDSDSDSDQKEATPPRVAVAPPIAKTLPKPRKPRAENPLRETAVACLREWACLWLSNDNYEPVPCDVKRVIAALGDGWTAERISLVIRGGRTSAFHVQTKATLPLLLSSAKAAEFEQAGKPRPAPPAPAPMQEPESLVERRERLAEWAAAGDRTAALTLLHMGGAPSTTVGTGAMGTDGQLATDAAGEEP